MEDDGEGPVQSSGTFVAWPEIKKFSTMLLHLEEAVKYGEDAEALAALGKEEGIPGSGDCISILSTCILTASELNRHRLSRKDQAAWH